MHGCTYSSLCIILKSMTSTSHSAVHSSPCVCGTCWLSRQRTASPKLYVYVVYIKHACISKCMSSRLQKLCLHAKTINKLWLMDVHNKIPGMLYSAITAESGQSFHHTVYCVYSCTIMHEFSLDKGIKSAWNGLTLGLHLATCRLSEILPSN